MMGENANILTDREQGLIRVALSARIDSLTALLESLPVYLRDGITKERDESAELYAALTTGDLFYEEG